MCHGQFCGSVRMRILWSCSFSTNSLDIAAHGKMVAFHWTWSCEVCSDIQCLAYGLQWQAVFGRADHTTQIKACMEPYDGNQTPPSCNVVKLLPAW